MIDRITLEVIGSALLTAEVSRDALAEVLAASVAHA